MQAEQGFFEKNHLALNVTEHYQADSRARTGPWEEQIGCAAREQDMSFRHPQDPAPTVPLLQESRSIAPTFNPEM